MSHRSRRIEALEAAEFAKPLHESFNCGSRDARHLEWRPPTTSIIMWAKHDMDALIDQNKLYVTKGDCDADRPTIAYLEEKAISA